jgi:hypothetical protein
VVVTTDLASINHLIHAPALRELLSIGAKVPSVFFSYSHADEALRDQLEKQLSLLKRQGIIDVWHDRRIGAGQDFARAIDAHVETDDIILLLVSADFIDSDYCYEIEMKRAMERHDADEAVVIPVILRACEWHGTPFGKLNATPPDGKPVTQYPDRDQALLEVAKAVRAAAQRVSSKGAAKKAAPAVVFSSTNATVRSVFGPRSSNLRLAKTFSQRDMDEFQLETFEFMAKFFENSLDELTKRNPGIEGRFRRIDGNRFTAKVYKDGSAARICTIFIGSGFGSRGIGFSHSEGTTGSSYNEMLTVEADDQSMFLRGMGMSMGRHSDVSKLTQEGAAEFYWAMLIDNLQG